MNIIRQTRKALSSLLGGIAATTDSPGSPACKTESLLGEAFAETYKIKLNDARLVFTQIVRMTSNNPAIDQTWAKAIHKIASDAYEAANE